MATLKAMFKLFDGYSSTIDRIYKKTDQATDKILEASGVTDRFNKRLKATGASANAASGGLGKLISVAALVAGAIKGMGLVDEYTNIAARLNLINDGLQTQAELQEKIFAAAERSRGTYNVMADAVSRMGLLAGEAFASNDELIAFTELLQKSFRIAGASTAEQASAMLQLTQAMAAGRLQGDEFRSIMENAPMLADAIAKYMGKSKGELKELSAEGAITADIIKGALFSAADDINDKFATMPMTFGDIWNKIKNRAGRAFAGVMEDVSMTLNTDQLDKALDAVTGGFVLAARMAGWFIDTVVNGWDIVGPILATIGGVLLANIVTKLWAMLPPLYAINWPILLIGTAIGLLIYAMSRFGDVTSQVFGYIGGGIGVVIALIYNMFASVMNGVLYLGDFVVNTIISLVNDAIGLINLLISAANKIPGVDIGPIGTLEYVNTKKFDFASLADAWNKGQSIGQAIGGSLGGLGDKLAGLVPGFGPGADLSEFGTSNNPLFVTSKDKMKVDMADEDLKYLRDIAQREYINKFTTATLAPNINIKFGDVHQEADANKVAGRIKKILQEEIAMAAEGSYA